MRDGTSPLGFEGQLVAEVRSRRKTHDSQDSKIPVQELSIRICVSEVDLMPHPRHKTILLLLALLSLRRRIAARGDQTGNWY
jgi:hypothetical protein